MPGEQVMAMTIKLLDEIHDVKDEKIEIVVQNIIDHPLPLVSIEDRDDKPINTFRLHCTECGRTYNYELQNIIVPQKGQLIIAAIVECKRCRGIQTYEIPAITTSAIMIETLRMFYILHECEDEDEGKDEAFEDNNSPIRICEEIHLQIGRKHISSPTEAYHCLMKEIEKRPCSASIRQQNG